MEITDIPALAALMRRHTDWIGAYKISPPDSGIGAVQLLTAQLARHQRGAGWYGVILEGNQLRGQAALLQMRDDPQAREILVWVDPTCAGRGLGTAAASRLCDVAFDELALDAVTGRAHPNNARSLGMLLGAGLTVEKTDPPPGDWIVMQCRRS